MTFLLGKFVVGYRRRSLLPAQTCGNTRNCALLNRQVARPEGGRCLRVGLASQNAEVIPGLEIGHPSIQFGQECACRMPQWDDDLAGPSYPSKRTILVPFDLIVLKCDLDLDGHFRRDALHNLLRPLQQERTCFEWLRHRAHPCKTDAPTMLGRQRLRSGYG